MPPDPDDELLPWWWQRQADPTSPDVVPGPGAAQSTTHRDWVLLGTLGGVERAVVDPRGLVTPWPDGWSLDWWIGADDAWHLPSRSAGVRQRLVEDAPVVETVVRIPGGDMVHRAWTVASGEGVPDGGAVVVELENASPVPVAVALALRPFNVLGRSAVGGITMEDLVVSVDGRPAMVLPKRPSRFAVGTAGRDSLGPTLAGDAVNDWPDAGVRCGAGRASAAFLFPLPHTARVRVLLPLVAARPGARRRSDPVPVLDPRAAPEPERVASGWEAQVRRAPRLELPEPRLGEAVAAARRFALLHAAGEDVASWPPAIVGGLDTAELARALDQHALHQEAEQLLLGFADRQGLDGSFAGESTRVDAAAAWLHGVAQHVLLTGDPALAEALVGPVAKAAHHLRRRLGARRGRRTGGSPGLFPPGPSAPWTTASASAHHDAVWARRGLLDAAFLLDVADQAEAAAEPRAVAADLTRGLVAALAEGAAAPRWPGGALAASVALAATLAGPGAPAPELTAALDAATDQVELVRGGVWRAADGAGLSPRLTAWAGVARLGAGRADVDEPLRWLLERGAPTWTWPELVHPRSGGGCAGEGHHAAATAAVLHLARALAVVERDGALAVLPGVPDAWLGQPVEVHGLPTAHGLLSYALRWHGERPALLWELEPHADGAVARAVAAASPLVITAPGLDPGWATGERRGEALLTAPSGRTPDGPGTTESLPDLTATATASGPVDEPAALDQEKVDLDDPPGGGSFT